MSFEPQFSPRASAAQMSRRLTQWRNVAPTALNPQKPLISFTFDDAPRSAVVGAEILERFRCRGGFYIATSCLGRRSQTLGDMIRPDDVAYLARRGHEIGALTHTYLDCAGATPEVVEADVIANYAFLRAAGVSEAPFSFAYPLGETCLAVKQWAAQRFTITRGRLPGVNGRISDRSQLRSTHITSSELDRARARRLIAECVKAKGWLIFHTHDVRSAPSPMGISLRHLVELVQLARDAGADILPPHAAAAACGVLAEVRAVIPKRN
jgi:peptidoglycan/xylan/chitin deacetylase (PgdA/CDA1 family)